MDEGISTQPTFEVLLSPDAVVVSVRFPIGHLIPGWLYQVLQHFRIGMPVYSLPVTRSEGGQSVVRN